VAGRTSAHLVRSANFVRWAVTRRHASGLTAPATRWAGPSGPLDQDRRWADARRLLHDGTYPAADRAAGLLVLLYAQKLSVITALTTQHVLHEDGRTLLRLGSRPIVLPAPLDALVTGLADGRRPPGSSLLSVPSPWLFPGRWPGRALTEDALAQRLHALGISPRQGRSTALFTLAAEVPAAILAKTLGIHVQAAIQWQKLSAGDWAAYAADISGRAICCRPCADARRAGPRRRTGAVIILARMTAPGPSAQLTTPALLPLVLPGHPRSSWCRAR
jgi:hypothetical protein